MQAKSRDYIRDKLDNEPAKEVSLGKRSHNGAYTFTATELDEAVRLLCRVASPLATSEDPEENGGREYCRLLSSQADYVNNRKTKETSGEAGSVGPAHMPAPDPALSCITNVVPDVSPGGAPLAAAVAPNPKILALRAQLAALEAAEAAKAVTEADIDDAENVPPPPPVKKAGKANAGWETVIIIAAPWNNGSALS
eukprot:jgi/Mesvir1/23831/Mv10636-RA.1